MYVNYSTSIMLLTNVDLNQIVDSDEALDALDEEHSLEVVNLDGFLPSVQDRIKEVDFVIFLSYTRFKVVKVPSNFSFKTNKSFPMNKLEQCIARMNLFLSQMNSW